MRGSVSLSIALVALRRNVVRTLLSVLGVVIGVAAVVTMVALGRGARAEVSEEVESAGANLVFVRAGNYTRGGDAVNILSGLGSATTLVEEDARAIARIEGVLHVSAEVDERAPMEAGEASAFGLVRGVEAAAAHIHGWDDIVGAFFDERDVRETRKVAVLGRTVAQRLNRGVGQSMRIREVAFDIVGVLESGDFEDSETAFIPYTSLQNLLGIRHLHGVTVFARTAGETTRIAEEIRTLLRARHGLDAGERTAPQGESAFSLKRSTTMPDDFTVRTEASAALTRGLYTTAAAFVLASMPRLDEVTSEEMAATLQRADRTMTLLLASIATVSLVVGGIGIMNIMLLAVTERTREIGLRVSVGARRRDILYQFLTEAVTLALIGGIVGIVGGFLSARTLTGLLGWPTYVSPGSVALAFGLSFAVGIVFGYYPAERAARLDPIDALRHE
ncbi:MAG TPA: ABC transporter permease [Vicinamibacteria bacterium]|nr:ABC transporter permease [Vicinamibacteria bacterium]